MADTVLNITTVHLQLYPNLDYPNPHLSKPQKLTIFLNEFHCNLQDGGYVVL